VSSRWVFSLVGLLAILAGAAMWAGSRGPPSPAASPDIAPSALFASTFADTQGQAQSLGQFQGRVLVVNFWATWCAPCREEMPAFTRLQTRWADRNVQFLGLANEEPRRVERFGKDLAINYPLWVGGDEVGELSRRLGNERGVLPYTVILDARGQVLETRVGPYTEAALELRLKALASNAAQKRPISAKMQLPLHSRPSTL
jgi:thiol-disulfide isomerase/thioredoxin